MAVLKIPSYNIFTFIKKVIYKLKKDFWKIVENLFSLFVIAILV